MFTPSDSPIKWYQSRWFAAWAKSASQSLTLGRNEKVEQYIRNKTHKPNALTFWVEGGVILLYVGLCLILCVNGGTSERVMSNVLGV